MDAVRAIKFSYI